MSDQIKVVSPQIESVEADITSTVSKINTELDTLKSDLAKLVWEGSARDQFNALMVKWNSAATDLNSTLAVVGKALTETREQFLQTEQQNANLFTV